MKSALVLLCATVLLITQSVDASRTLGSRRSLLDFAELVPAPASIGAAVPLTYFGPAPSQVNCIKNHACLIILDLFW
jgi:hypothetical protein